MEGLERQHPVPPPPAANDLALSSTPALDALVSAAAEVRRATRMLGPVAAEEDREEALRRLQRLAAELEGAAHATPIPLPAHSTAPSPSPLRARLLVADDEADAREALTQALADEHDVITATDGQQALDLARARHPDVVLLDLNMPLLDGFEVLEQLRAEPATEEIPVILVTGRGDDAGKVRGLDLGAVDYLLKPFSERELRARVDRTLRLVRNQTALREQARTDALTGLPNLRAFRARLDEEVKRARRYRTSLTCVMADVDQLKTINDALGHAAGDRAIFATASVIGEELRETDFAARYGGDEFVILLPHTAAEEGRVFAERVCARLRAAAVVVEGRRVALGASFGVAHRPPQGADGPAEALVQAADAALYTAKRAGRGRVVVAEPGVVKP